MMNLNSKRVSMVSSQHQLGTRMPTLQIFNSITGETLLTNAYSFTTFESFKQHVSTSFGIPLEDLFLLTPFGIRLKFSMLVRDEVTEVYVFDKRLISKDVVPEEMVRELNNRELINMIRPMSSPLANEALKEFVANLKPVLQNKRIKSQDISLNDLRLLLNSLKRNTGWAAALLSDFRKTVCSTEGEEQNERETANIIASLNVLLQHLNNVTNSLQKDFADTVDQLDTIKRNALNETWRSYLDTLQRIKFSISKTDFDGVTSVRLSELLDERTLLNYAQQSSKAMKLSTESLGKLKVIVEREILTPKSQLTLQYDELRTEYLNSAPPTAMTEAESEGFHELENLVSQITYSSKSLPSFEELITTESATSSMLSSAAVEKINTVVDLYNRSIQTIVPRVMELADQLYQKQLKKITKRQKLQSQIMSTSFSTARIVSLYTAKAKNSLSNSIKNSLEEFRSNELRLSLVKDLPLLFGSWLIANLKRLKYADNTTRMVYRINEILEMFKFTESSQRARWIEGFSMDQLKSVETSEGGASLFALSDAQKKRFIEEHLLSPKVILNDASGSKANSRSNTPPLQAQSPLETNQHDRLNSLNKLLRNINTNVVQTYTYAAQQAQTRGLVRRKDIWDAIADYVTVKDIVLYLQNLRDTGYKKEIVAHLFNMLQEYGAQQSLLEDKQTNAELTFNTEDPSFIKLVKDFVKMFETDGLSISIGEESDAEKEIQHETETSSVSENSKYEKMIKGYEHRIRTLENLLHQHNFRKFNEKMISSPSSRPNIAQVPSYESRRSGPNSPQRSVSPPNRGPSNTLLFENGMPQIGDRKSPAPHERDSKISELHSTNQSLNEEVMKLRSELKSQSQSVSASSSLNAENQQLRKELDELRILNKQLQDRVDESQSLREKVVKDKQKEITGYYETMVDSLRMEISGLRDENDRLTTENKYWKDQYEEVNNMKRDVLANMTEKEAEYNREIMQFKKEISDLKLKIDDLEDDDNENIAVLKSNLESELSSKDEIILQLDKLVHILYLHFRELCEELISNLALSCVILESIGLLMSRDPTDANPAAIKINRVRGLKQRKKIKMFETNPDKSDVFAEISSEVLNDAEKYSSLTTCEPLEKLNNEAELAKSVNQVNMDMLSYFNFDEFEQNYRNFKTFVTIEKVTVSESVAKRFRDVEQMARNLQKENNQYKSEISTLNHNLSQTIKLRSFKPRDLVLFLPARVDNLTTLGSSNDTTENAPLAADSDPQLTPWAAFNVGAPRYYLINYQSHDGRKHSKNDIDLTGREWMLGRIVKIEEKHVTSENFRDAEQNPFGLSLGETWFAVEAKEKTLGRPD